MRLRDGGGLVRYELRDLVDLGDPGGGWPSPDPDTFVLAADGDLVLPADGDLVLATDEDEVQS
jgi:hypothetical protein